MLLRDVVRRVRKVPRRYCFRQLSLIGTLMLSILTRPVYAEKINPPAFEKILLAAPSITNLVEGDGNGYYQRLLSMALDADTYEEKFFPFKRALLLFQQSKADCVYSLTDIAVEALGEDAIISSYPLGSFAYYIFSPKQKPKIESLEQLSGKRIGLVIGHESYYQERLPAEAKISMVQSDQHNMRLLELGRIDYFVGALPDLMPYEHLYNYQATQPLIQSFDRVTCHNTSNNRAFLNLLDKNLKQMKADGWYQKLGKQLYLDF